MNTTFSSNEGVYEHLRAKFFKCTWIRNQSLNMVYTIFGLSDKDSLLKVPTSLSKHLNCANHNIECSIIVYS